MKSYFVQFYVQNFAVVDVFQLLHILMITTHREFKN